MEIMPIDISLSVENKDGSLIANLLFFNKTPRTYYLDRFSISYDGKFYRNMFHIVDELGRVMPYTGMMVKRLVKGEHFLPLETGAMMKTTVIINNGYLLKKGLRYTVRYMVNNPGYLRGQEMMKLQSNEVKVEYE